MIWLVVWSIFTFPYIGNFGSSVGFHLKRQSQSVSRTEEMDKAREWMKKIFIRKASSADASAEVASTKALAPF